MSVKNDIIAILEAHRGEVVSGEKLAQQLNISRQYVWKTINNLKSHYNITASTNNGYILNTSSDVISKEGIALNLLPQFRDINIIVEESLDSTNNYAKKLALGGAASGTVIIAEKQTAGRGRYSKTFYSPIGSGIYMSIILRPILHISNALLTTVIAANAVCKTIESYHLEPRIKWVNDIFVNGKKVCGILTEAVSNCELGMVDYIVVGIGINVKPVEFPLEISKIATSLNLTSARNPIIALIINNILDMMTHLNKKDEIIADYKKYSLVLNKQISYSKNGIAYSGTVLDINESANLVVKTPNGIDILSSGEISLGSESFIK